MNVRIAAKCSCTCLIGCISPDRSCWGNAAVRRDSSQTWENILADLVSQSLVKENVSNLLRCSADDVSADGKLRQTVAMAFNRTDNKQPKRELLPAYVIQAPGSKAATNKRARVEFGCSSKTAEEALSECHEQVRFHVPCPACRIKYR